MFVSFTKKIAPNHPLLSCFVLRGVLCTACCSPPHFPQLSPSFLLSHPVLRVSVLSLLGICRRANYAFPEASETSNGLNNSTFSLGQLRLPQFICRRYRLVMVSPDAGDIVPWRCGNVGSWVVARHWWLDEWQKGPIMELEALDLGSWILDLGDNI